MMDRRMVSDSGLKALHDGYSIEIRVPWYRSLPVSVIEVVEVALDGAAVDLADVAYCLEGEEIALDQLRRRTADTWFVLDSAYLRVRGARIEAGRDYAVSVTLAIYPPYIKGYRRITRTDKNLTAR